MCKLGIYLLVSTFMSACYVQNPSTYGGYGSVDSSMPNEPGKCYAKCLMPDLKETYYDTIGRYDIDEEIPDDQLTFMEYIPKSTYWEKKKADKRCMSADPNDCLVWCLREIEAHTIERESLIEIDTLGDSYIMNVITYYREVVKPGGYTEWLEVLCDNRINEDFYSDVRLALIGKGFDCESADQKVVKGALMIFQKNNGLPIGQLDIETLDALGVR